jgi:Voltage-dependent anion channel
MLHHDHRIGPAAELRAELVRLRDEHRDRGHGRRHTAGARARAAGVLAHRVWVVAAALLVVLVIAVTAQWARHPTVARSHARNPQMSHFYGAAPMALMTVAAGAADPQGPDRRAGGRRSVLDVVVRGHRRRTVAACVETCSPAADGGTNQGGEGPAEVVAPCCRRVGGSDDNTELSHVSIRRRGPLQPRQNFSQASRIAATPWPPAAQMEIRPRTGLPVSAFFSASCLASWATIRPPVAANG